VGNNYKERKLKGIKNKCIKELFECAECIQKIRQELQAICNEKLRINKERKR